MRSYEQSAADRGRPRAARCRRSSSRAGTGTALLGTVLLHASAAATGLAGPPILGGLVQSVQHGTTAAHVNQMIYLLFAFLLAQTALTFFARRASFVLSEKMFAELREDFMRRVLALPLSTVERAGTGDLISRTTADVDALTRTIRFAVPETTIAAITAVLTVAAAIWVSPLAALPCIAGVPALWIGTRWYLQRAPQGYLWERAAYATLAGTVGETVEGGRTRRGARPRASSASGASTPTCATSYAGRAAHALPAHDLVPLGRRRLRPPGRCNARVGRLARLERPRLDRRGDGGRALRRRRSPTRSTG